MAATVAIVLAGGRSARMGTPKAELEWHGSTLLGRVVDTLGAATGRVVVVRAPGQALPALPDGVVVVEDADRGRGPLEGMLAGLRALGPHECAAFVCAVDMPFVEAPFARAVLAALPPDAAAAVPRLDGRAHPLAAAYRPAVADRVAALLDVGERRVGALIECIPVAWLDARALPGGGASLRNVNTPAELAAAGQTMREKATDSPAAAPPRGTSASAVAPVSDVMA
jgi:molybdopterin-guanine dinucleotide biosynthesis protein A